MVSFVNDEFNNNFENVIFDKENYDFNVFINCPFDKGYLPIFHAIIFTVMSNGFCPVCVKLPSGKVRLEKICEAICDSRLGIHDISCVKLDSKTKLPRFNMPFELGLFIGCLKFGGGKHSQKDIIVMDKEKYRYHEFLSNINGLDCKAHKNKPEEAIKIVHEWLRFKRLEKSITEKKISKYSSICKEYQGSQSMLSAFNEFVIKIPEYCRINGYDFKDLKYVDFCNCVLLYHSDLKERKKELSDMDIIMKDEINVINAQMTKMIDHKMEDVSYVYPLNVLKNDWKMNFSPKEIIENESIEQLFDKYGIRLRIINQLENNVPFIRGSLDFYESSLMKVGEMDQKAYEMIDQKYKTFRKDFLNNLEENNHAIKDYFSKTTEHSKTKEN
jgi:hypothetical protein